MIRKTWYKLRATLLAPLWLIRRYIFAILAFLLVFGAVWYIVFMQP
jgi:hypothetical protein